MKNIFRTLIGRKNTTAQDAAAAAVASALVAPPAPGCKVLGTKEQPVKKVLDIPGMYSVKLADGKVVLKGYANTKGQADRYGDVPTVFPALRSYVYELNQFKKNPVMLLNHDNMVESIAGSFQVMKEDENGLYFEATFSESSLPAVMHARTVYSEGHAKALSIAGRWYFENKDAPEQLTYAEIFEVSLVAVGADPNALAAVEQPVAPKAVVVPTPEPIPAPCCYRHAGNVQKDLPCATLAQVEEELNLKATIEALLTCFEGREQAALKADMEVLAVKLESMPLVS
jgi:HK97 family phage prohead protease